MSYLTQQEFNALQESDLHRKVPFLIQGASQGHFSIARYYGGVSFNGSRYTYIPLTDELVRDDVIKWIVKRRKATL